jgi:hypothetical protein
VLGALGIGPSVVVEVAAESEEKEDA